MIVFPGERMPWYRTFTAFRGSVIRRIWGRLLLTTAFATVVTWTYDHGDWSGSLTTIPFSLIGLALGIFLGFRNNTSYNRFWEGRILWGRLVNTSRSFTRQVMTLINAPEAEAEAGAACHRDLVRRAAVYIHTLRHHLRNETDLSHLERLMPAEELRAFAATSNPPIAMLHAIGERVRDAWRRGWIEAYHLPVLEDSLTGFANHQGGCERIKATPIPFSYSLLIHRIVAVYCLALPFGIVKDLGWVTPVVVLLVDYAFYGLDAIGDSIENPFGHDDDDLPLTQLATMIEVNIRERLPGETDLPALVQPVDHILS